MPLCSFFIERHQLNLVSPHLETKICLADPKTSLFFCPTSMFQTNELQILQLVTVPWAGWLAGCTAAHGRHKSWNILCLGLTSLGSLSLPTVICFAPSVFFAWARPGPEEATMKKGQVALLFPFTLPALLELLDY
jgi:hypothetical protein